MSETPQDNYLAAEVMTAPPQKLQLMLVEAAIRSIERARQAWQEDDDEQAGAALIRAQRIVGEMLASLDHDVQNDLVKKVAAVYLFVFRSLAEAAYRQDGRKLDDALKVLRHERETWRLLCKRLGGAGTPPPHLPPGLVGDETLPHAGLSLEA